jgi:hypothetical protein
LNCHQHTVLACFLRFKLLAVLTFWIKGAFESTHHCIMSSSSNHGALFTLDGVNNAETAQAKLEISIRHRSIRFFVRFS